MRQEKGRRLRVDEYATPIETPLEGRLTLTFLFLERHARGADYF